MDYLLEIQGEDVAFTGAQANAAPTTWGQTLLETIMEPPPIQTMDVDPYDGSFGNGGGSIMVIECEAYIRDRKVSPITTLTADLAAGATTANVASTSAFPASGTVWIGREAMTYSGKTATTLTGLSRGVYGTWDVDHSKTQAPANSKTEVYGFNPTLYGRKCWLHSFDPDDPANTKVTIAVGYMDGISFSEQGFAFSLISVAQVLENESIGTGLRASGTILGTMEAILNNVVFSTTLSDKATTNDLLVELDDIAHPFPYVGAQLADIANLWLKVGDEVIKVRKSAYPAFTRPVNNVDVTSFGPRIQTIIPPFLRLGHTIRFTDSSTGETIDAKVTRIESSSGYITHSASGYAPAVADTWVTPDLQMFSGLERAQAGTKAGEQRQGLAVEQVYVQESDHVDSVLQLLHSGNDSGNAYDVLPEWIGAGIHATEIDTDSFDGLRPYSTPVIRVISAPLTPKRILQDLAHITGGRVFVSQGGKITARRDFAPYPDSAAVYTATYDQVTDIPSWGTRIDRVYNQWAWKMPGVTTNFVLDRSVALYGERGLPTVETDLVVAGVSMGVAEAIAIATLLRHDRPNPEITITIPEQSSVILQPGQIVAVSFLHLPNQQAGSGLVAELYEVIEFAPGGDTVSVRLLRLPQADNVGLIAPAAIVQGVSGSDVTLKAASVTHLAASTSRLGTQLEQVLGIGEDGTEDVDWFLLDDEVQLIDASTLGGATPTTANTTITSVNYATRIIQVATLPGWLAAGDYVRLATYATTKAGANQALRTPWYVFWADSTPALPGGDDPYVWGM